MVTASELVMLNEIKSSITRPRLEVCTGSKICAHTHPYPETSYIHTLSYVPNHTHILNPQM